MSNTTPTKRFKRDIELAKLQAKISEYQTAYYSIMIFAFTTGIGIYVALDVLSVQTRFLPFLIGGVLTASVIFVFSTLFLLRMKKLSEAQIKKDIESIYNDEPIEY